MSHIKKRVAVIVDEFTLSSIIDYWDVHEIDYFDDLKCLKLFKPELLFVESVWKGVNNSWLGLINNKLERLTEVVNFCKMQGIPTVFWNKEDPIHFEDFTDRCNVAGLFDYIFTTEIDCIGDYKVKYNHENCYFLPFFYNERNFNASSQLEKNTTFFAGSYYRKYVKRNASFAKITSYLDSINESYVIFNRHSSSKNLDFQFPSSYRKNLHDAVDSKDIHNIYKKFKNCINVNTVVNGQTMFARRVLESLACGTRVFSNYSRSLEVLLPGLVSPLEQEIVQVTSKGINGLIQRFSSSNVLRYLESIVFNSSVIEDFGLSVELISHGRVTLREDGESICFTSGASTSELVAFVIEYETISINSALDFSCHAYINLMPGISVDNTFPLRIIFDSASNEIQLDVWGFNKHGKDIFRRIFNRGQEINIDLPIDCVEIKLALRVKGKHSAARCRVLFGKVIKVPRCIVPVRAKFHFMEGAIEDIDSKILQSGLCSTEIFYFTGSDFDFEYRFINGNSVIIGGNLVLQAVKLGRERAAQLES